MNKKPTYKELEQTTRKLEKEIENRKKAEQTLRESDEMCREAYEIIKRSPAVTFLWKNIEGWPVEFVSENVMELLGYSADDFVSGRVLYAKVVHPDDLERVAGEVANFSIGKERKRFTHEPYRIVTKDGKIKWLADRTFIRRDEKGKITHYQGIVSDISDQVRAEKKIRLLKDKYEDLYHNAPIMYLSLDVHGIIIECNNVILDKLGYTRGELTDKQMATLLTKESAAGFKKDFPELIKTGKLMGLERQLVTKSGDIVDVQLSVSGEYDMHGKMIKTRASFEDISGLKRAEDHIHSLTHALINAHESERQLISRELHDRIAQDLSTLKIGFDNLLYNQTAISPEERQKAAGFSEIFKNTITAVRDLSYDLRPPFLDQMGLAEAISHFCESFSEAHGMNVHFNTAGMDSLRLNFETETNLYRLVQEGLNNIRKHAEAADAFVKLIAASPNIILRIEDNGRGFDVERRLEAATNEKRMGLRSMEERTCLLEGEMTVESLPLKGTKIFIKIPQKKGKYGTKENDTGR